MRVAQAFATRSALALELSERVGREAVRALLEGQELERRRLARELHDETGQALASILLGLRPVEADGRRRAGRAIRELVASALANIRRLTVQLRPAALDDFGLGAGARAAHSVIGEQSGLTIHVTSRGHSGCFP